MLQVFCFPLSSVAKEDKELKKIVQKNIILLVAYLLHWKM